MRAVVLFILASVLGAVGILGCRKEAESAPEPVRVLATTQTIADIAKAIGGSYVSVEWYVESGQSLAELVETPQRRADYRQADLVITRGASDPWTLEGYGNTYQDRKILRLDTLLSARGSGPSQYIWLDPQVALELSNVIVERLSILEPRGLATYKANAEKFTRAVADAMEKTTASINRAGRGPVMMLDRGFLPLAYRFGLTEVRAPSISLTEPSNYNVRMLKQAAADAGVGAIFANSDTPLPLLRDWESRLGMPVLSLDALGTSAPTGRNRYLELLRYNLDQLASGVMKNKPTTRYFVGEQSGEVKAEFPRGRSAVEEPVATEPGGLSSKPAPGLAGPALPTGITTPRVEMPKPASPTTRSTEDLGLRRDRSVAPSNPFAPAK